MIAVLGGDALDVCYAGGEIEVHFHADANEARRKRPRFVHWERSRGVIHSMSLYNGFALEDAPLMSGENVNSLPRIEKMLALKYHQV